MATTTTTTTRTTSSTVTAMAGAYRNPKDSMKSTWRTDPSQWGLPHRVINFIQAHPTDLDKPVPVYKKTDPIPTLSDLSSHIWILLHALLPVSLQWLYCSIAGHNFHPAFAVYFYMTAFLLNNIHEAWILRRLGHQIGFLDGDKHERDQVPDVGVGKALLSVQLTTLSRTVLTVFLTYDSTSTPSFSWWLPIELGLYSVVLDFFFYAYHRACHEVEGLWKYHRTHHLTKHPTPLLSSYADSEQEFIEMVLVPLLTYTTLKLMGFPMGFYDWWLCHQYVIFAEAFGHSGLRIYSIAPCVLSPLLVALGMELQIEDHDLHHRNGWRKSSNYGKQTRVWDRLFGTCGERIESTPMNVDPSYRVRMPLF